MILLPGDLTDRTTSMLRLKTSERTCTAISVSSGRHSWAARNLIVQWGNETGYVVLSVFRKPI